MDRIGAAGGTPLAELANGQMGRQDENLATGQEGTLDPSLYSNALQEEIMLLLSTAGITPNINNWTQVLAAIITIIAQQHNATYNSGTGAFYFSVPIVGGAPMIVQGFPASVAAGSTTSNILLPVAFPNGFGGGVVTNSYLGLYGFGIAAGTDNAHVEVSSPLYAINTSGGVAARGGAANCYCIVWGN